MHTDQLSRALGGGPPQNEKMQTKLDNTALIVQEVLATITTQSSLNNPNLLFRGEANNAHILMLFEF